jgi:Mannosylglycerate hydrolase MGH1-like glycoside hydrolase domain/Glycosyl hydrolases family 2, sugar binding domain
MILRRTSLPWHCVLLTLSLATFAGCGSDESSSETSHTPSADAGHDVAADTIEAEASEVDVAQDVAQDVDNDQEAGCADPGPEQPLPEADLQEVRASILSLREGWRFATDPGDVGGTEGWFEEGFDDAAWSTIDAGQTWEEQGFDGYDGVGWYRRTVDVPSAWQGSAVRVIASGIDDEYDLYVNGAFVRHFGEEPDRSVWGWQTLSRVDEHLRFGEANTIAIRVNDWGNGGGVWRDIVLRRSVPIAPYGGYLPEPVLPSNPAWEELYWAAWQMAFDKIAFGNASNSMVDAYMDEGFNEQIYQWDSSFICLFGRYGSRLFPVMPTLDNFYDRQRSDGYIQRVYSETDGGELGDPKPEEPMVNPPLFAWVEWEYYRTTGDDSRLAKVLPILERYYLWLQSNVRLGPGQGLYNQTDLGSGMDNTPRGDIHGAGWADMSSQQVLAATHLSAIAKQLGDDAKAAAWEGESQELSSKINALLWNELDGYYYDLTNAGQHSMVRHIGAFWTILAGVADDAAVTRLVDHLEDPTEFKRPHRYPTLAASHPDYAASGNYWRGSVWAPTNYMIIKGLQRRGYGDLARAVATEHLTHLANVYASPPSDEQVIAPEERDGEYKTLWECYAPESSSPATRWDATFFSRQDFVGWTGLGPIAMLIEDVLGFEVVGAEDRIIWDVARLDEHGIRNLALGSSNIVSLVASSRATEDEPVAIEVEAVRPFSLQVRRPGHPPQDVQVCAGQSTIVVE